MSDLEKEFNETVDYVKNAEGDFKPSNELKLELYGLYKQATEGDVTGSRPGMMDFINRAKYDAWADLKGISKESAMQRYIDSIENLKNR
ncbi:acyl-CoA-binding protein [Allohahella marinimesophila]|uniref:Acyl-CoA-binding protein n=1 Tax=Allohahella marinimesophila TaxID=1054972 RepID=A0ABP7PIC3_9GAMM